MRIVHGTSNVTGVPVRLMKAQRRLGYQASAVLYLADPSDAPESVDLWSLMRGNRLTRKLKRARVVSWVARTFDVFHFHYHTTFMRHHEDVALLKALGKTVIFHLHGCEIRQPDIARARHEHSACSECTIACMVPVKRQLPQTLRRFADATIVAMPELLEYWPTAQFVPIPVDIAAWQEHWAEPVARRERADEWNVVHIPTNREIKGTRHIIAAVEDLRREGFPVKLHVCEHLSRAELQQLCQRADVIVDQVMMGWVGTFAVEMMAMGKPVIANIRPDLRRFAPDLPVVHADPRSLADTLRDLLQSPGRRRELAILGPLYAREHHNLDTIAAQFIDLYRDLRQHRAG